MATTPTKARTKRTTARAQDMPKDVLYATLGAGQLVIERAKDLAGRTRSYSTPSGLRSYWMDQGRKAQQTFDELSTRGRTLVRRVETSAAFKRAEEQTKQARTQVRKAADSLREALRADVEATKAAAKKVS